MTDKKQALLSCEQKGKEVNQYQNPRFQRRKSFGSYSQEIAWVGANAMTSVSPQELVVVDYDDEDIEEWDEDEM